MNGSYQAKRNGNSPRFPLAGKRVYVAGHTGLVGSALIRRLASMDGVALIQAARPELDLTDSCAVEGFLAGRRPDAVVIAAGRVGGISANSRFPAEFIRQNLMIEANLIHGAWKAGVRRLLNFGAGCMYPRECAQPMRPEMLMTGRVEATSEPYAMAKLAGLSLCSAYRRQYGVSYINAVPANLYGPGESFDIETAHVIGALIRRFHEAKERGDRDIRLWGSGKARREFLHVDDLAEAAVLLLESYDENDPVNIGSGQVCSIHDLAAAIAEVIGFRGELQWDASKPDGAAAKSLDSTVIRRMGWSPRVSLREGLRQTYAWFLEHTGCLANKL